jgi:tRNA A-37 threonylcarbamoyl transferase component Bud32
MGQAHSHGFPVVRVLEVRDDALVLAKVDGPSMGEDIVLRPWKLPAHMRTLADLHRRVAEAGIAHLDLHPQNVLLSDDGPVVIDWTNARGADPALDAAVTWVILRTVFGPFGRVAALLFRNAVGDALVREGMARAVAQRIADRNTTSSELRRLVRLQSKLSLPA